MVVAFTWIIVSLPLDACCNNSKAGRNRESFSIAITLFAFLFKMLRVKPPGPENMSISDSK